MALFSKNDGSIKRQFLEAVKHSDKLPEKEFLEALNETIVRIETDKTYSTKDKLKIFELFTRLSNCAASERTKYIKKISRLL